MPDLVNKNHSVNQDILGWIQGDHVNLIAIGQLIKAKNFINLIKSIDLLNNKNFENYKIIDLRVDGKIIVE